MMKTNPVDRYKFIEAMKAEGMSEASARLILRNANTIQRLSVAECNGDWPCDNGERKVKPCSRCEAGYVPSELKKGGLCPNCRAEDRIKATMPDDRWKAHTSGDPRGCCVIISVPSGKTDDGGRTGICVPTPRY